MQVFYHNAFKVHKQQEHDLVFIKITVNIFVDCNPYK